MQQLWQNIAPVHVDCEEPTMLLLDSFEVPEAEWPWYLGYMKRMIKLYENFTDATLENEKTSLINEYVLRGKDRTILEEIQPVAAECAGFEVIEGNYRTWNKIWEYNFPDGLAASFYVTATFNRQYIYMQYQDSASYYRFSVIKFADGSQQFINPSSTHYLCYSGEIDPALYFLYNTLVYAQYGGASFSILAKYALILRTGGNRLEVWKDGALTWTSPAASAVVSGATTFMDMAIRYDGKYIVAVTDNNVMVCFEGVDEAMVNVTFNIPPNTSSPPCLCKGYIVIDGVFSGGVYLDGTGIKVHDGETVQLAKGNHDMHGVIATIAQPQYDAAYPCLNNFCNTPWVITGSLSVSDPNANPTVLTVNGDGTVSIEIGCLI